MLKNNVQTPMLQQSAVDMKAVTLQALMLQRCTSTVFVTVLEHLCVT